MFRSHWLPNDISFRRTIRGRQHRLRLKTTRATKSQFLITAMRATPIHRSTPIQRHKPKIIRTSHAASFHSPGVCHLPLVTKQKYIASAMRAVTPKILLTVSTVAVEAASTTTGHNAFVGRLQSEWKSFLAATLPSCRRKCLLGAR